MDEYISRNELLKDVHSNVAEAHNERCAQLLEAILNAPTADVVPRSEVDLYRKQVDELEDELASTYDKLEKAKVEIERLKYNLKSVLEEIPETKREFASEIFAEIEEVLNRKISRTKPQFERLHDKENSLSIWGYKDMGYFRGVVSICEDVQDLIAELKKEIHGGI